MNFIDRLRAAWANLHPFLRLIIAVLIIGGVMFFGHSPAKSLYHQWKNAGNLKRARQALENSQFAEARDYTFQILRNDPKAYEPLPILLRATATLNDPLGVRIAAAMLQDDRTSGEDHLLAWTQLCQAGPAYITLSGWPLLPDENRKSLDYQLPIIDRMLRDDMMPTAATIIAAVPEPYPVELRFRLLQMLARTATDDAYSEFHHNLLECFQDEPEAWPRWLELIDEISQSHLHNDVYTALPPEATNSTTHSTATELRVARCQMAADPENAQAIFEAAFKRFQSSHPVELTRWCLQIGRPDSAAECLDLDQPSLDSETYRLQVDVLEATGQADALLEFLMTPPAGVPSWEALVHRADIAQENHNPDLAEKTGKAALKSAIERSNPLELIKLAREAQARDLDALALEAWTQALIRGTGPIPPSKTLSFVVKQLSEQKREDELFAVLDSLRFVELGNPVIMIQHLYLACLTGRADGEIVAEKLLTLHTRYPDQLPIRCTLAIAYILSDEPGKAAALLDDTGIDWFATDSANRAIRGITLAKSDRVAEARIYFEDFPWDELLPSEKRVFESLVEDIL